MYSVIEECMYVILEVIHVQLTRLCALQMVENVNTLSSLLYDYITVLWDHVLWRGCPKWLCPTKYGRYMERNSYLNVTITCKGCQQRWSMYKQLSFKRIVFHTNNLVIFVHTECCFEDKRPPKYLMPNNRFIFLNHEH